MRLLHALLPRYCKGAPRRAPASHARSNPRSALRESVPLHGLPTNLRSSRSSDRRPSGEPGLTMNTIGKPRRRVDGRAKVTGQTRFADDIMLPRMLHMKLLRSPHAHALIESVDIEKAKAHSGVHLVLTG